MSVVEISAPRGCGPPLHRLHDEDELFLVQEGEIAVHSGDQRLVTRADGDTVEPASADYAFGGLPSSVPVGTHFSVANEADEELHELVAFRLADDDRSLSELLELDPEDLEQARGPAALEQALGRPTTVLLAEPGGPQISAVGDGTLTEPGRYAFLCFIPTGADPQEYLIGRSTSKQLRSAVALPRSTAVRPTSSTGCTPR
jgi:hypothetical protein